MKHLKLLAAILLVTSVVQAQTAPPSDAITIQQELKKLDVLGSVLYVAAHPDDENTRLLAYLALEKHYRTGYLALTRGDGGQNLIGNEQSELLGLIRTQELLAARRVDGAEQFFSRANDFGFSKGPEETLKIWDHEKVLGDAVWVIRNFRPDIIICRFTTTGEGGHGHHTSSAIIAQEAFAAAADPKRFPEQLKYTQVWQAKRLLVNGANFGGANTEGPFKISTGAYNAVLGKGYGEVSADSRSNHKTQGFGSAKQRGDATETFRIILGDAPKTDLMDGVNTTWSRVKGGEGISAEIATIRKNLDIDHPEKSVPALVALLTKVEAISDPYWKEQKTKGLKDLIAACAGLWFEAYAPQATYAVGEEISVRTQVVLRSDIDVKIFTIGYNRDLSPFTMFPTEPIKNANSDFSVEAPILANTPKDFNDKIKADEVTQPYWLKYPHGVGLYETGYLDKNDKDGDVGQKTLPENIPYSAWITFKILGKNIQFERPIQYKYVDPAKGEIYQPLVIAPPVTANIVNKDYVFNTQQTQTVQIKMQAFTKAAGSISLKPVAGWKISPEKIDFDQAKGAEWLASFIITPADSKQKVSTLQAVVKTGGKEWNLGIQRILYDHVPAITLFPPAETKLINIDLKTAGKKIGYVAGAGDLVPEALMQVGYEVHQLTEADIMNADLSVYDAIVTGVRAYNVNPRLAVMQPRLLDYVNKGGNLVVQYNNNNGIVVNPGPYPFRPVNQRVTDENAAVTFLDPTNPVLNYPNKITQADFEGWIQERGLYFVSNIDPKYKTILQMNDPGEQPNPGSLIVGDYGKGRFIYTSLAFFRELPAGVPGAYRLFVNLLSKPR
ncbi:PIG-L family deacetylase [Mucilaginibacter auburnensis]|uniref:GlcNAc-PI de-N-acetylase n=1 Tax=Mucilaginibacter auburnensis TaxID=1457233 RepID=A0A2H9VTD9_9SPHI|nr:PIG-L family deacetylase [Mucilaginibacter auburnensis]PJJ84090.1 GlcNAc-PI de-N-acetylase [Mucilaginibacter auburnensis]